MTGSQPNLNTATQQNITFHADEKVIVKHFPSPRDLPVGLRRDLHENRVHSLIDYLQRPIRVTDGSWSTSQAANTELFSFSLPEDAISTSDMFANKMQGFLGFRAKACVKVQINAQRFQQGRLLLHYVPNGQVQKLRESIIMQNLTLKTQTPRVEIDCSTTTSAILEMPYVSPYTHFNFQDYTGPIGNFHMCVYSPLVSTASSTVSYTVWVWFEDIELSFPTYEFTPQAEVFRPQGISEAVTSAGRAVASVVGVGSISEAELAKTGPGPVGRVAATVSAAADALTSVPMLAPFAKPASWIASIVGGLANVFGWSNPNNNTPSSKISVEAFNHVQNVDGLDNAKKLALFADNAVDVLPGFSGTNTDEMAIAHVARIPCFISNFSWSESQAVDTVVTSMPLALTELCTNATISDGTTNHTVTSFAPMSYVANAFRYWRGSVTFTFKVIKTEFHSGRLQFSYAPGFTGSYNALQANYTYREVFDLRYSNEFSVTIPYAHTRPYAEFAEILGTWWLTVAVPLVSPDTVYNALDILLEVSAGPDFEVAAPDDLKYVPVAVYTSQSEEFVPQLGENEATDEGEATRSDAYSPLATSDLNSGGLASAAACIGERILSLRTLLKRHSILMTFSSTSIVPSPILNIVPTNIMIPTFPPGSPITYTGNYNPNGYAATPHLGVDLFSYFGGMYMFRRGGTRIRMYNECDATVGLNSSPIRAYYNTSYSTTPFTIDANVFPTGSGTIVQCSPAIQSVINTGGIELECPQYTTTISTLNRIVPANFTGYTGRYYDPNQISIYSAGEISYSVITRQLADDGNFGFFVGVLPCIGGADFSTILGVNGIPNI